VSIVIIALLFSCVFLVSNLAQADTMSSENERNRTRGSNDELRKVPVSRPLMTELNFSPFEASLKAMEERRISELLKLTAESDLLQLRQQLVLGKITARELSLFYLWRIYHHDSSLRSVLELNPDALLEADGLDSKFVAGQSLGRLHGLPILLKDNIAAGDKMHTASGRISCQARRPLAIALWEDSPKTLMENPCRFWAQVPVRQLRLLPDSLPPALEPKQQDPSSRLPAPMALPACDQAWDYSVQI